MRARRVVSVSSDDTVEYDSTQGRDASQATHVVMLCAGPESAGETVEGAALMLSYILIISCGLLCTATGRRSPRTRRPTRNRPRAKENVSTVD